MNFVPLHVINLKLLTIANSFLISIAEHENFSANKYEQEDHDGPISLTWPNRFAYLLLKFQPSSLL